MVNGVQLVVQWGWQTRLARWLGFALPHSAVLCAVVTIA